MKYIKWKSMIVTSIVCLLSVFIGLAVWNELPDTMAIHFNIHNQPDNFASKEFAVLGLPFMMAILQVVCCIINDINAHKYGERKKFETVTKWIIPVMAFVLQGITVGYSLGWNIDIGKSVAVMLGVLFLVLGNYMPKLDYAKNRDVDTEKARKINRFIGNLTVIMGFLMLMASLLPSSATTIVCLSLLIPYAVICIIYGIVTGRK